MFTCHLIFCAISTRTGVLLRSNPTLLFLSDCGILQFTLFPKLEQIGTAHSLIMHLKCTSDHSFMIIVAPFYLFYISSYYLVFSLYRYSVVLAILASVLVL